MQGRSGYSTKRLALGRLRVPTEQGDLARHNNPLKGQTWDTTGWQIQTYKGTISATIDWGFLPFTQAA
jgi:hypothetical protein